MHARRRRQGNYAVIFGLSMVTILGFAALAVDISYIRLSALQAQNAADAGAHAAMIAYRSTQDESDSITVAESVVAMNAVAGASVLLDTSQDIEFGGWDYNDPTPEFDPDAAYVNAAQVTVRRTDANSEGPVDLLLAPIFGHDVANITAIATGALRFREVVVALDITPSFKDEFELARQALMTLLDGMWRSGAAWPGDRIGLVTYVGGAEVWTPLSYVDTDYATIADAWTNDLDWCSIDHINYQYVYNQEYWHPVNPPMMDCIFPNSTATNWQSWHSVGAAPGQGILSAADELIANGDPTALKYIVVLADGGADCDSYDTSCSSAQRLSESYQEANAAAANNISIHTVYYNVQAGTLPGLRGQLLMNNLPRGYGYAYSTENAADLPDLMEDIVSLIPVALVQ